ncbi:hypothetical protein D9756_011344 [Leucocoprinus leucothites]|uniref:Uncharacterized protein n=1 Tax=Leucocoprinus leucothites TaxID=201217 RepID=A0A8H5CMF4_9AGAR|nr:hypothetical protein D9756_011344 [Leucoagaricus leucothites]
MAAQSSTFMHGAHDFVINNAHFVLSNTGGHGYDPGVFASHPTSPCQQLTFDSDDEANCGCVYEAAWRYQQSTTRRTRRRGDGTPSRHEIGVTRYRPYEKKARVKRERSRRERESSALDHADNSSDPGGSDDGNAEEFLELSDLSAIRQQVLALRQYQATITEDCRQFRQSNQLLWQEVLASRERSQKNTDTVQKILKFLGGVFGPTAYAPQMWARRRHLTNIESVEEPSISPPA